MLLPRLKEEEKFIEISRCRYFIFYIFSHSTCLLIDPNMQSKDLERERESPRDGHHRQIEMDFLHAKLEQSVIKIDLKIDEREKKVLLLYLYLFNFL